MSTSAALVISRVAVESFRCLEHVEVTLEAGTTVLVGENNSGKSSLLLAIATALGKRRSSVDDLRRNADGSVASYATIDVFFSPPPGSQAFSDDIRQRLISVQRDPTTNRETLGIRTVLQRSGEGSFLLASHKFLQPASNGWVESPAPAFQPRVLDLVEAHVLDASRDLLAEMPTQTSPWGRVLSDLKIPDLPDLADEHLDPRGLRAIELDLGQLSERVRKASPVLTQLHSDLSGMSRTQATVERVDLVPLPLRVEELARTMEVVLHQRDSARLPLRFHGSGSRSLAALLVFRTMCELKVGADQGLRPHLLTLLEEPEAHLHPHAITALIATISDLTGQRVVSTHSATLVAEVPPASVRLLRRTAGGIVVTRLTATKPKHMEHFRRFFGRPFGETFFARLVVLGDGVTERNALPILVGMGLGTDAAALGITFVDCKSMGDHEQLNKILSALHELGIPWLCFADNDAAGLEGLARLRDPASGLELTQTHPAVAILKGTKQIEQLLIDAGYGAEITEVALGVDEKAEDDNARLKFLASHKGWAAEAVAVRAKEAGMPSPPQMAGLVNAIRATLGLADPVGDPVVHT